MKKLLIRAIGRITEPWHQQAVHMYQERLAPLSPVEIVELPEGHKGSAKPDVEKTRMAEAESLLKGLPRDAWVVALDENGKRFTSTDFANALTEWGDGRQVVFLIGGSWGLDGEAKARANVTLSLGAMTLPHALARIVLLEQLYRATMIRSGKTYHK